MYLSLGVFFSFQSKDTHLDELSVYPTIESLLSSTMKMCVISFVIPGDYPFLCFFQCECCLASREDESVHHGHRISDEKSTWNLRC